jgi:predicted ATPase
MIRLIEAMNYRCLRHLRQPLGPFHVLVGPNASGKSSFLDVLMFISRLVTEGLEAAIAERSANVQDLFWRRDGMMFELAIEAIVPDDRAPVIREHTGNSAYAIRYELAVGIDAAGATRILAEQIHVAQDYPSPSGTPEVLAAETLFIKHHSNEWEPMMSHGMGEYEVQLENPMSNSNEGLSFESMTYRSDGIRSVLAYLPRNRFPSVVWLHELLRDQIRPVDLESSALRRPSPPGKGSVFVKNGANLPWMIGELQEKSPEKLGEWINHVQQALPDVAGINIFHRPEDRVRYIVIRYKDGLEVPSWLLSDGTLRLLALTLIAYLRSERAVYLVEEPETNIHPLNVEFVMQSLSSAYDSQILVTTHSPTVLDATKAEDILVFSRTADGGTSIVKGSEHPALRQWKGEPNLSVMHASGVLG